MALISVVLAVSSAAICVLTTLLAAFVNAQLAIIAAFLPILGIGAAVTGWLALRRIAASSGALSGRPLALLGLFVGLLTTVLQGSFVIGAMINFSAMRVHLVPSMETFFEAAEARDVNKIRTLLSTDAGSISDERILAFARAVRSEQGQVASVDFSVGTMIRGRQKLMDLAGQTSGNPPADRPHPVEIHGRRMTLAWVFLDQDAVNAASVRINDLLILGDSGTALTLRKDGPAAQLATYFGLNTAP